MCHCLNDFHCLRIHETQKNTPQVRQRKDNELRRALQQEGESWEEQASSAEEVQHPQDGLGPRSFPAPNHR